MWFVHAKSGKSVNPLREALTMFYNMVSGEFSADAPDQVPFSAATNGMGTNPGHRFDPVGNAYRQASLWTASVLT